MSIEYDAVIVGGGASGTYAALTFSKNPDAKIALFEQGGDNSSKRNCSAMGRFGRSLFSGSFISSPKNSKFIDTIDLDRKSITNIYKGVVEDFRGSHKFDLPLRFFQSKKIDEKLLKKINKTSFDATNEAVHYFSPSQCHKIADKIYGQLMDTSTDVYLNNKVFSINRLPGGKYELDTEHGTVITKRCIFATGRSGMQWAKGQLQKIGVALNDNRFKIGFRTEITSNMAKKFFKEHPGLRFSLSGGLYEATTSYVHNYGKICQENYNDMSVITSIQNKKESGCAPSFSVTIDQHGGDGSLDKVINAVHILNVLSDGNVVKETPGQILDNASISKNIEEFRCIKNVIKELDTLMPNFISSSQIYLPVLSTCSLAFDLNNNFETNLPGVFIVGEASGITSNMLEDAASGVIAAQSI